MFRGSSVPKDLDLHLTISFSGEQEIEVPGGILLGFQKGRATFGIRRGQLRFHLTNCTLPLETCGFSNPLPISVEVEQQRTQSREIQGGVAPNPNVGTKAVEGATEKQTKTLFQVKKLGAEDAPAWVFESRDDSNVLEGEVKEALLGILKVLGCPCEMKATFTVRGEDVKMTWGSVGNRIISRNFWAAYERAVILRYIKPLVEESLVSEGRWQYG